MPARVLGRAREPGGFGVRSRDSRDARGQAPASPSRRFLTPGPGALDPGRPDSFGRDAGGVTLRPERLAQRLDDPRHDHVPVALVDDEGRGQENLVPVLPIRAPCAGIADQPGLKGP